MRFAEHTTVPVSPAVPHHTQYLHLLRMVNHVRLADGDEHVGSKKQMLSELGNLTSGAPMSADVKPVD